MAPPSDQAPPPSDRRRAPRPRKLLSGKLVYGQPGYSLDVTIRDLTDSGARVRLATDAAVHDPVWLIDNGAGVAHRAVVAWRKPQELGLRFDEAVDLRVPASGALHHLRRLWMDSTGR